LVGIYLNISFVIILFLINFFEKLIEGIVGISFQNFDLKSFFETLIVEP
jgi:hypothetical protein